MACILEVVLVFFIHQNITTPNEKRASLENVNPKRDFELSLCELIPTGCKPMIKYK